MIIRTDFKSVEEMPPRYFLEQITDSVTKAYFWLWDHKNPDNFISMTWKDLSLYYHKNTFRTNLRKLNNQGLLSYQESKDGFDVELIGWDDVMDMDDDE